MKYIVMLGDGMADEPLNELGGKTPLEVAKTPMQILYMKVEHELRQHDMIRRILKEKENVF